MYIVKEALAFYHNQSATKTARHICFLSEFIKGGKKYRWYFIKLVLIFVTSTFTTISPASYIYSLVYVFPSPCSHYSQQVPHARIAVETGSRNFKMRSGWRELRNGTALQALHTN